MKQLKLFIKTLSLLLLIALSLQGWGQTTLVLDNFGTTAQNPISRTGWTANSAGGSNWELRTTGASTTYTWTNPSVSFSGGANLFTNLGTNTNTKQITYSNSLSTIGYSSIAVRVAGLRSGTVPNISVLYSTDGINFINAGTITLATTWAAFTINLPSGAENASSLSIRFEVVANNNSSNFLRLDDFHVIGTATSSCTTPTYSFAAPSVTKLTTDGPFTNTFTSQNTSTKVWSSSNETVATVDASGEVTILTAGTTNIQVTQVADDPYCAVSTSYPLTVNAPPTPTITIAPSSLSGFNYLVDNGPSAEQSFTIEGSNLSANISITPPTNYEISTGTGVNFVATNPITLTQSGGTVINTPIYVRLKSNLAVGNYNSEEITASSTGATDKIVTLNGSVTVPTGKFIKITSTSDLTDGEYVIVNSGNQFAMNNTHNGTFLAHTAISPTVDTILNPSSSIIWKIEANGGGHTIYNEQIAKFVSYTGSSNNVQIVDAVAADNQRWTITYVTDLFRITNMQLTTRLLQFNNNTGQERFACYTGTQQNLLLYKKLTACTTPTYSFADASVNKTIADVPFTNTFTSQNTSTKVWSSSNQTVATVDANGEVTILAVGTTNIQVTQVADATYCAVNENYLLTVTGPTITVSTNDLSGFTYLHGSGPSAEQNFEVSGTNLTANVVITPPTNYEISTGTGGSFVATNPINLAPTSGTLAATTIYVRLKAALAVGTYNETISLTSTNAATKSVNVNGSVTTDQAPNVIITEVYGAGGNSGAILKNDFIELYNTTNSPINIGGWSVQYYSAAGTSANVTAIPAGTIIPAKSHFLIQQAGGTNGVDLYQPDLSGNVAMAAASGKVILFTTNSAVTTTSDINSITGHSNFKDYLPYGASTPVWGSAVGTISITTSATRKMVGGEYVYTQNIGNDFEVVTPTPQNTGKYRSVASGDWNNLSTWQFTDNGTWNPSANIPTQERSKAIIQSGHEITITDDATISVLNLNPTGKISLNDTKTLVAKDIILESNNTGTATIVDNNANGGITISGNAITQQYLTGTGALNNPTGRGWYVSSPVFGATSATFIPTSTDKIWSHSEIDQVNAASGYTEITNTTTPLVLGSGYVVRLGLDATVSFAGTAFNTGNINLSDLTRTGTTNAKRGFHLIGNPYPSYLNWDNATKTNIDVSMWYRTTNTSGTMVFDTYNASNGQGTNNNMSGAVTKFIPPMQGFWIKATTDGQTGTLGFNNSMRSHQSGNLLKTTSQSEILRLNISNGINSDEAIILFNQSAGTGLTSWDSEKMMNSSASVPQIFSKEGSTNLVINSLPEITNGLTVPLFINLGEAGQFSINPNLTEMDPFTVVTLQDLQLGIFHDLSNGAYNFTSTVVNNSNRFVLHFNTVLSDENITTSNTSIYAADNKLHINSATEGNLEVFDLLGRRIIQAELNSGMNVITLNAKGVYLVRVSNNKEVITEKISLW